MSNVRDQCGSRSIITYIRSKHMNPSVIHLYRAQIFHDARLLWKSYKCENQWIRNISAFLINFVRSSMLSICGYIFPRMPSMERRKHGKIVLRICKPEPARVCSRFQFASTNVCPWCSVARDTYLPSSRRKQCCMLTDISLKYYRQHISYYSIR